MDKKERKRKKAHWSFSANLTSRHVTFAVSA